MTEASNPSADLPALSVVITNYNGRELLERCLPSVTVAAAAYAGRVEIILVDDCSTDDSRDFVRRNFTGIDFVRPPQNLGFQGASNFGFKLANHPIVISLNNDIEVTESSFSELAEHFSDPDLFAVSTRLLMWDRTTYLAGRRVGLFEQGHLRLIDEDGDGETAPTLFATGGACAFDRKKLLALDGFDPIFHPLYWEDIDLCYRAWKRGWRVIYDPKITLYHKHRATIETLVEPGRLRRITARNSYLFLWKNLTDGGAWLKHALYAPLWILRDLVRGRWRFPLGFGMALMRLPQVWTSRRAEREHRRQSDADVFRAHAAESAA